MKILAFKKDKDKEITEEDIELSKFSDVDIKENFPALFKELTNEKTTTFSAGDAKDLLTEEELAIDEEKNLEIELESETEIKTTTKPMEKDYLRGFDPQAIDFVRRAKTNEEALEVLNFLEQKGELSTEQCENLKQQLAEKGLASFGEHKEDGYYFEYQRKRHLEEKMRLSAKQPGK